MLAQSKFAIIGFVLLLASFAGLFLLSATRDYAVQSLSAADRAYEVYDDFSPITDKGLIGYKILAVGALLLSMAHVFHAPQQTVFRHHGFSIPPLYGAGALIILAWWPSALIVSIALFAAGYPWKARNLPNQAIVWTVMALFTLALVLRVEKIPNVKDQALQNDAKSYMELSQTMRHPYDTGRREPLLVYVNLALSYLVSPPSDLTKENYLPIRYVTVALSCVAVVLIYLFGVRFFSHQTGFIAALIAATDKALIYRSLQGLRLEIIIILSLLAVWLTLQVSRKERKTLSAIIMGFVYGLLLLTRTSFLPFTAFLLGWGWLTKTKTFTQCAIAGMVCTIMMLPYYIHCWQEFGDPFYDSAYVAEWYYKAALNDHDMELSEPLTMAGLMFHKYSWYQSIGFTVIGAADTLFGTYALRLFYSPFPTTLIGASLIGYTLWLFRSGKRFYLLALVLLIGPVAFFLGLLEWTKSSTVFDWRLLAHLIPWMAYACAEGLIFSISQLRPEQ